MKLYLFVYYTIFIIFDNKNATAGTILN